MPYGTIKVDNITFDNGGTDKLITVSGLFFSTSGALTVTGTISGGNVTAPTATFTTLTGITTAGTTVTFTSGSFTSLTGVTTTGTTATFTSGSFTSLTGVTTTVTSGVFGLGSAAAPSIAFSGDTNNGIYSPGADQVAISTNGTQRLAVDTAATTSTLPVVHPLGAVGTPSITFTGDLNTGIYSPAADTLAFVEGGAEAMRLDSSGRLGLGTSSPDSKLNVVDASGNSLRIGFGSNFNIYDAATHAFRNNGGTSDYMRIDSSGRVGIGTSSPSQPLQVVGAIASTAIASSLTAASAFIDYNTSFNGIRVGSVGNTTGTAGPIYFSQYSSNASVGRDAVIIDSSGRLGIGTTGPSSLLHLVSSGQPTITVADDAGRSLQVKAPDSSANPGFIGTTTNHDFLLQAGTTAGGLNVMRFNTAGSERARIDSSGRLLVGTSSNDSNAKLVCQGFVGGEASTGAFAVRYGSTRPTAADIGIGTVRFESTSNTNLNYHYASISCATDGASSSDTDIPGRLVFSTTADGASSPTERMRIGNAGNVGIGQADTAGARLAATSTGTAYAGYFTFPNTAQGIGIASTGAGTVAAAYFFNNGTNVGSINMTSSATSYATSSDYRLKENVVQIPDGITRLLQLKPSRFNFIVDPDHTVDGFIAHEAQAVVPECVTGEKDAVDEDGNPVYQGIDQSKLVPLLTAALKEAIAKIEALETRLSALEGK